MTTQIDFTQLTTNHKGEALQKYPPDIEPRDSLENTYASPLSKMGPKPALHSNSLNRSDR